MIANVSPQTASNHLKLLLAAGFLKAQSVGRNRFFKLGTPTVGVALESLAATISVKKNSIAQRSAPELIFARACYDHLAGELGVTVLNQLQGWKYIREYGKDYRLTNAGEDFVNHVLGQRAPIAAKRRRFAYPCLDWSQRVPHLGGALGAALLEWLLRSKAVARQRGSRSVRVTDHGRKVLNEVFGIKLNRLGTAVV